MVQENYPTNVLSLFRSLWLNYSLSDEINLDKGFMSSGGFSFSAVQFITEFQSYTDVKYDFILNLIADISYSECTNKLSAVKLKNFKSSETSEGYYSLQPLKKLKVSHQECTKDNSIETALVMDSHCTISLQKMWKYNLSKCVDCSPSCHVIDGVALVVAGSHSGKIAVICCDDGSVLAEICLPDRVESKACIDEVNKQFCVGCYDGFIYMYKLEGSLVWSYKTADVVKSGPIIAGDNLICGSYDKWVYCLNTVNGDLKWKSFVGGQILARAQAYDSTVIVATLSGSLTAVNMKDGFQCWTRKIGFPVFSNFIIFDCKCIVADVQGTIHWISTETGNEVIYCTF